MTAAQRVYTSVAAASALLLLALWLLPRVEEALAPEPVVAWAAIEIEGSGEAVVGSVEMPAGAPFRVHAVLEAEARDGEPVYYTQAPALRIGGRQVPKSRLRRWDRAERVKVLWFTVEPRSPWRKIASESDLDRIVFEEFFHPEWGTGWQVEGDLSSRHGEPLAEGSTPRSFGTQRFMAWIELFDSPEALMAKARFRSPGAADLPEEAERVATVTATLAGPAGPASAVFGLLGLDVGETPSPDLLARIADLADRHLVFTPVTVLRDVLRAAGTDLEALAWKRVEIGTDVAWESEVRSGDLLRVGSRFVILYRDADRDGLLGPDDSCLDFVEGAFVRTLVDVFPGEGEIEWATLTR